jgi:maltose O-acetyltransferase
MKSEKEKMMNGELFLPHDPELKAERLQMKLLLEEYNSISVREKERSNQLLQDIVGTMGEKARIGPPFWCDYGYNIHLGDHFFANVNCVMLDEAPITFGDGVMLGPGVHIYREPSNGGSGPRDAPGIRSACDDRSQCMGRGRSHNQSRHPH